MIRDSRQAHKNDKLAVAQPLVVPGDVETNIHRMEPLVLQAASRGAGVVLFSECGLTGYDHSGIGIRSAIRACDSRLSKIDALAREANIAIVAGFYESNGGDCFNSAICFYPDGRRVLQRKTRIIEWEANNTTVRSAPRHRVIFDLLGRKAAILICADTGMDGIYPELESQGVKLVLAPTAGCGEASMGFSQRQIETDQAARTRWQALQHQVAYPSGSITVATRHAIILAACNQSGYDAESGYFHPGHSSVVTPDGRLAALIPGEFVFEHLRPQIAVAEID